MEIVLSSTISIELLLVTLMEEIYILDQFWLLRSHCYYMYSINMESGQGLSLVVRITKSDSRHAFRDSAIFAGDMIPLKHYNIKRSNTHMMQKNAT